MTDSKACVDERRQVSSWDGETWRMNVGTVLDDRDQVKAISPHRKNAWTNALQAEWDKNARRRSLGVKVLLLGTALWMAGLFSVFAYAAIGISLMVIGVLAIWKGYQLQRVKTHGEVYSFSEMEDE